MTEVDLLTIQWLLCSEEYLNDGSRLVGVRLQEKLSTSSRPTALLLGYFLETLFKAVVLHREKSTTFFFGKHIGLELIKKANMNGLEEFETDLVEFLEDCAHWGKYPSPRKPSEQEMISSDESVFANQTYFFNDWKNLFALLESCAKCVAHARAEFMSSSSVVLLGYVDPLLDRLRVRVADLASIVKGANHPLERTPGS